jgi:hypothetical protein
LVQCTGKAHGRENAPEAHYEVSDNADEGTARGRPIGLRERGVLWEVFKRHYGAGGDPLILVAHAAGGLRQALLNGLRDAASDLFRRC